LLGKFFQMPLELGVQIADLRKHPPPPVVACPVFTPAGA
jgi:hypothetical protein